MKLLPSFEVRLAENVTDLYAVQRLRYEVFVRELGANGGGIDHCLGIERDDYDPHCLHLMLLDKARGDVLGGPAGWGLPYIDDAGGSGFWWVLQRL